MSELRLVVSCEHGGRAVPPDYEALFERHEALLDSHRGWDPGALGLAGQFADAFAAPLYAATTARLLIDLDRSLGRRQSFSEITRGLSSAERQAIVASHYRPHRDEVENAIARLIATGKRVVHIASHSFTPALDGVTRQADVAWLYDPRRAGEAAFSETWLTALSQAAPGLRLHRNYPYQGRSDGLTSLLRRRFPDDAYVGIELEVNQRFVEQGGPAWPALRSRLVESLGLALGNKRARRGA